MDISTPDNPDAAWLRSLLAAHGCSQMQAARLIRYDPRTVRRWLAGDLLPPWSACELLRRMLGDGI